jgi:hypothetical protein
MQGRTWLNLILLLSVSFPLYAEFKVLEETDTVLILRFELHGSTVPPTSTAVLIGVPPDALPSVSIIDSESEIRSNYQQDEQGEPPSTGRIFDLEPMGFLRFQRIARLRVYPIQRGPSAGQIRLFKKITFKLTFPPSSDIGPSTSDIPDFEAVYRSALINPNQSRRWRHRRREWRQLSVSTGPQSKGMIKIKFSREGFYVIARDDLERLGVDVDEIDPRTFKLFSQGREKRIWVEGENDGKFDAQDRIIFYGERITRNRFTDQNVYWLSWGGVEGRRGVIKDGSVKTPQAPTPIAFKTFEHFEEDVIHDPLVEVTSELADHFFWTELNGDYPKGKQKFIQIKLPYAVKIEREATFRMRFQGASYKNNALHSVSVTINSVPTLEAEWRRQNECIAETRFIQKYGMSNDNSIVIIAHDRNGTPEDEADFFLDWIEFEYWRSFETGPKGLKFSSDIDPPAAGPVIFKIKGFFTPKVDFYQISDTGIVARIINTKTEKVGGNYVAVMEDSISQPTLYYAVPYTGYMRPEEIALDEPTNLRNPANRYDYVIISHEDFLEPIQRLADFRTEQGFDVLVVDVEDIYDEFSHGIFNPHAIRSFLRYAFFNWVKPPTYVLLVGDASYDYKGAVKRYYERIGMKLNIAPIFVPTYHSWAPVGGEAAMDQKFVEVSGDDRFPDMFIGRLPVQYPSEVIEIVDKIIEYETSSSPDHWQSRIMQVSDDDLSHAGDDEFERSREKLFQEIIPVAYEPVKVYLRKIESPMRANKMIIDEMNKGVIVAEYSGHGGSWTWADENIFRGDDIQRLANRGRYPFLITTTCLNGFFDMPQKFGERNLAEEFLIQKGKGAIAVLSASRLTFAYANSAFDRVLFKSMFNVDPPVLGTIISKAKVEFITIYGRYAQWIPGVEQYILFGDPAMKLKLPDLEIRAELESYSVDSSTQLVIKRNAVYDKKGEIAKWFNADIEATLIYPNNLDDIAANDISSPVKIVNCWNGEFGDIRFNISSRSIPGEGVIRLRARGKNGGYGVGGVRFSVQYPVILDVRHEMTDNAVMIYAQIQDNKGRSGIKHVECQWFATTDFRTNSTRMILGNDGIYRTEAPIPLPETGYSLHYWVVVVDVDDRKAVSPEEIVPAPIGINLAVSQHGEATSPEIGYEYSPQMSRWIMWAEFENNGDKPLEKQVLVCFFDGDPDRDGDGIVDQEAPTLGKAVLPPEVWEEGDHPIQKARVELPLKKPLSSGIHKIYVWIDPEMPDYDHEDKVHGEIKEPSDVDNKGVKVFAVNDYILGLEDVVADSLDKILSLDIPKEAVSRKTDLSIAALPLNHSDQPDIIPAFMPIPRESKMFKLELRSNSASLTRSVKMRMKYDRDKLESYIHKKLGLGDYLTTVQRNQLQSEVKRWVEHLAIFRWDPQIEAWRKLKSELVTQNIFHVSPAIPQNSFTKNLKFSQIGVDNTITPVGNWVMLFLDESRYILLLKREGTNLFERVEGVGKIGDIFRNDILGIKISLLDLDGEKPHFGDIFTFSTKVTTDNNVGIIGVRNYNSGDGTPIIEPIEDVTPQRTGNWVIIFLDKKNYQLFDENGNPVLTESGNLAKGIIDRLLVLRNLGIKINIIPGSLSFEPGDKFVFRTCYVGEVETQIDRLGVFTLMHGMDDTPPSVKLWVDGTTPQPGSVIPPRPQISILLEDPNFVDMSSFKLLVKSDRGGKVGIFQRVSPKELSISGQKDIIPIRYEPIFHIGRYTFRISVEDMCGNKAGSSGRDYVEMVFYVEKEPDLTSPKVTVYANEEKLSDGAVLDAQPHFVIIIEDDHGLDPKSLNVQFGPEPEGPRDLKENEYKFEFSQSEPNKAMLFFEPDCPNGRYILKVNISDTSRNKAAEELHIEIDEPVRVEKLINVPNPISKDTVFYYYLTQQPDDVTIKIYTLTGRLVKTLEHASASRKYNEEYWDTTDQEGRPLANGVYLYKMIVRIGKRRIEKIGKLAILR